MGTIFAISLRNLIQHRGKTLIIGTLITLAIALGLVGNAVLDTAQRSLKRTFTENFTGDVLVLPTEIQGGLFGASSGDEQTMSGPPILPMMQNYDEVYDLVSKQPWVEQLTSQISSYALFNLQDGGLSFGLTFGIDPEDYFKTFDNVDVLRGRKLKSGETGIMLHEKVAEKLKEDSGITLDVGDSFQLNNFGEAGFKVREVPIVGVFRFKAGNERAIEFMQPNLIDVNTLRALKGKAIATAEDVKFSDSVKASLSSTNDDFFSEDTVTGPVETSAAKLDLDNLLGPRSTPRVDTVSTDTGAWNYILIKLKPGQSDDVAAEALNEEFKKAGLSAKAQTWFISAQPDSGVSWAVSVVFNFIVWLIAIVSIIIIMNTLVASVMERTGEIGTMRAVGATKGFICSLFITETLTITAIFGVVGILLGWLVVALLNTEGIAAPNDFMRLIFGGAVLHPEVRFGQVLLSLLTILIIALVSWIMPVLMALKVSPLKAINTD